jgi:hypothetical protein
MNFLQYLKQSDATGTHSREYLPDPALAGIFAFFGISLGQFYNGRPLSALCWGAVGGAIFLFLHQSILLFPAGFFFLTACAIDAYSTAQEIQNRVIPYSGVNVLFWVEILLIVSLGTAIGVITAVRLMTENGIVF